MVENMHGISILKLWELLPVVFNYFENKEKAFHGRLLLTLETI
jgi:hypothetical protein